VLQPIADIARMCRAAKVLLHTDATQWVGRVPTDFAAWGTDLLTCSAHKLHGPKGVGALAIRRGTPLLSVLAGGPQERERRAGTENVTGIAGFGAAATAARAWLEGDGAAKGAALRDLFEGLVCQADTSAVVNARSAPRLWNTSNIAFPRLEAEAILLALSERGVAASAGAACSSGSLEPSPVLLAMGLPETLAHGSVRFSLSRFTTENDVREAAATVIECVQRVRGSSSHALR
jgi:cysteine desulfurase